MGDENLRTPEPQNPRTYEAFTTDLRSGRCDRLHLRLRGAAGVVRHCVRAGRALAEPRRRVLGGGNDALSTLVPYRDQNYYSRRPTIAVPAGTVLQIGRDRGGAELGLHPRLTGLKSVFDAGRLAIVQRTGYENSSRSHFTGFDIWGTANPGNSQGTGWLGRYLDSLPQPVDPLVAWNTQRETPRPLMGRLVGVPAITSPAAYSFATPNTPAEAVFERAAQTRISSHLPVDRPHLAFVNSTTQAALGTLDRVATVAAYQPAVTYPNNGFGQALQAVAGAMNKGIGTKVFWVQTGGYDTHAGQGVNQGAYFNLMATLNDGLKAFYDDLSAQSLLGSTLVMVYTEFGRRITENGSQGTDHGAGGVMMLLGGQVRAASMARHQTLCWIHRTRRSRTTAAT